MTLRVRDLMTPDPISVSPRDDLATAHALMQEHQIRHLPVVDKGGVPLGVVTQRDLLQYSLFERTDEPGFLTSLRSTRIGDIMAGTLITAGPDTDIRSAAQVMFEHKYGCLPVVENRRLVGILTEADFVHLMAQGN